MISCSRVGAFEIHYQPEPLRLDSIELSRSCILSAEEMMGIIETPSISFQDCYFVTHAKRTEAFCLNNENRMKVKRVVIADCKLNGRDFGYDTVLNFLSGKNRAVATSAKSPMIVHLDSPFWRPHHPEYNKQINLAQSLAQVKQDDEMKEDN